MWKRTNLERDKLKKYNYGKTKSEKGQSWTGISDKTKEETNRKREHLKKGNSAKEKSLQGQF